MKIGFIGLGRMGTGMALNLRNAGYDVTVHDTRSESARPHLTVGSAWAGSVAEVGRIADVVFTSVPGPKEMTQVADELFPAMRPGSVWFDLTTNSATLLRTVSERFATKGIAVLDAPVSGGPSGAASRKLAVYVGGAREVYDRHKPLLDAIGDEVMHVGPIGAGTAAKLAHNCSSFALRVMLAEVFSMGVKAGVDPGALWHAMRTGGQGRSRTYDRLADKYLVDNYEPASFTVNLALKDLGLGLELGKELDVPMKFIQATWDSFEEARQRGWGERDSRTPMKIQNERAGVSFAMTPDQVKDILAKG
jgi:3-hydroxyisobutyrate dehydrogenase